MSVVIDIAEAVKESLNGHSFAQPFAATRDYRPAFELKDQPTDTPYTPFLSVFNDELVACFTDTAAKTDAQAKALGIDEKLFETIGKARPHSAFGAAIASTKRVTRIFFI